MPWELVWKSEEDSMQESLLCFHNVGPRLSGLAASAFYALSHLEFPKMRFLLERTDVQIDKEWDCFCQPTGLLLSSLTCVTCINITLAQSAKQEALGASAAGQGVCATHLSIPRTVLST